MSNFDHFENFWNSMDNIATTLDRLHWFIWQKCSLLTPFMLLVRFISHSVSTRAKVVLSVARPYKMVKICRKCSNFPYFPRARDSKIGDQIKLIDRMFEELDLIHTPCKEFDQPILTIAQP